MGRGVSSGGGQSSLGYLFGTDEPPKPSAHPTPVATTAPAANNVAPVQKPSGGSSTASNNANIPAGIQVQGSTTNNYFRADGQNTGNFITVQLNSLKLFVVYPTDVNFSISNYMHLHIQFANMPFSCYIGSFTCDP
ncbi:putative protein SPIRAL1-like 1 [Iris pallida]|uniref:Protein SPIRAL1-like 1 n=1 Tax=Iris pallida TaxID=29817 RepID=A0AAX6IEJ9_IRIPA|nr:putative protein SPIRAL1-like 1 [Iris pallida]